MGEKSLKIVFMGTSDFAVPSMEAIAKSNHTLQAVVTLKDRKAGRGQKYIPTAVKEAALLLQTEIIEVDSPKEEHLITRLQELQPDIIIVIAFRILPDSILSIPTIGCINLHASLLPKFRGPAPINWAIISGEKQSGNTVFFLDSGIDTGKIIGQSFCDISPNMTTGELYESLKNQGPSLIIDCLHKIIDNSVEEIVQDDTVATKAPKLFKQDALIDFNRDAVTVHNHIRGMNPFPGSHTFFRGKLLKIVSSEVSNLSGTAGSIISLENNILTIACKTDSVSITMVAPEGKKAMDSSSFINGYKPLIGEFVSNS